MKNLKQYYRKAAQDIQQQGTRPAGFTDLITQARSIGYTDKELHSVPQEAVMGMGCGNPGALAQLHKGQTVLDLGCGGGLDVFLAAAKVGKKGYVIGIDITQEMVQRAKANAGNDYPNVEFLVGDMENLPVETDSVDVIISNCVINHARDKVHAFQEALRCLKPGGKLLVSDLVLLDTLGGDILRDKIWGAWLANALEKEAYLNAIAKAGFADITIVSEAPYNKSQADERLRGKISSISIEAHKPHKLVTSF